MTRSRRGVYVPIPSPRHGASTTRTLNADPMQRACERFWAKVNKNGPVSEHRPDLGPCWLWTATTAGGGRYGQFWDKRNVAAHRFAYEILVGPIPEPLTLDHLCRVTLCVNPAHLEAVTHQTNVLRGNSLQAVNARKTHCKHGHAFSPENTYVNSRGGRGCRACRRKLSGRDEQVETGSAAVFFGDPVARGEGVAGDGVGPSPSSPVDTSFYPDLSLEALRVERIRLFAICNKKELIAS